MPTQGSGTCATYLTGTNCIRNVPQGVDGGTSEFQNALNVAGCGDTIVLTAGVTYSGNFTVPSTGCSNNSGWMVIESSAIGSLPASGNRVCNTQMSAGGCPTNQANMAIVSTPNTSPAIQFQASSNHWRLMGLVITTSYVNMGALVYYLVNFSALTVQAQLPTYITFDRDMILGLSNMNTTHGIGMDGGYVAIVDSYCDEIHAVGYDSQCFFSYNGTGPYLIQNNFIEAGAETTMFGGADPAIANLVMSDITYIGNLVQKNVAWQGETSPYNWVIKNSVEFKNASRVLFDGNVIQYIWVAQQSGYTLLLTPVNQNGTCTWCVISDFTITHNLMQHGANGFGVAGGGTDGSGLSQPSTRILIQNDLWTDIGGSTWGGGGYLFQMTMSSGLPFANHVVWDHDTGFESNRFFYLGASGTSPNNQLTNTIADLAVYGLYGVGTDYGTASLNAYWGTYVYNDNVYTTTSAIAYYPYPTGSLWAGSVAGVGFTSVTGTDPNLSGNFQLLNTSAYYQAGTDGKDIGVWDWTCFNAETAAALAGTFSAATYCGPTKGMAEYPTASPAGGTYSSTQTVTLSQAPTSGILCYTLDGTTPVTNGTTGCTHGTLYSTPVSVSLPHTLNVASGGTGYYDSYMLSNSYAQAAGLGATISGVKLSGGATQSN
jgi:hypothetical protein